MMKRYITLWTVVLLTTLCLLETAHARRLKVYSLPKQIGAGQFGILVFENPDPEQVKSKASCTADKLIGWTKMEMPILRIEQNGKQLWMPLGSYETIGDSVRATFMAPLTLEPGNATLFLVNDHDASVPYPFTVGANYEVKLKTVEGMGITPLGQVRLIGEGLVPTQVPDAKPACDELEGNIGYSKLGKAEQWKALNKRMTKEWANLQQADLVTLEQNGKTWTPYVQQCGLSKDGIAIDFIAPPDIKPGTATLTVRTRISGKDVATSNPLTVNVVQ